LGRVDSSACLPLPEGRPLAIPVHIGTCAWSFDEWRGVFYPEHLAANERLAWYARSIGSVEIDSTFYATPAREVAQHWADSTPEDFIFSCKMPRVITHERKLLDCREPLSEFLHGIEPLVPKLGAVLLQFPGTFRHTAGHLAALREFLELLPSGIRFAVEFRDAGWHLPRVAHLLEDHAVSWVWNDVSTLAHQSEAPFDFAPLTTDFIYLRLLGDLNTKYAGSGQRLFQYTKLMWPRDGALESWSVKVRQHEEAVARALIYANNHYEGFSPATCERIGALLGVPLVLPDFPPPVEVRHSAQLELDF